MNQTLTHPWRRSTGKAPVSHQSTLTQDKGTGALLLPAIRETSPGPPSPWCTLPVHTHTGPANASCPLTQLSTRSNTGTAPPSHLPPPTSPTALQASPKWGSMTPPPASWDPPCPQAAQRVGGLQPPSPLRGERSRPSPGLPLPTRHCGGRTDGRTDEEEEEEAARVPPRTHLRGCVCTEGGKVPLTLCSRLLLCAAILEQERPPSRPPFSSRADESAG